MWLALHSTIIKFVSLEDLVYKDHKYKIVTGTVFFINQSQRSKRVTLTKCLSCETFKHCNTYLSVSFLKAFAVHPTNQLICKNIYNRRKNNCQKIYLMHSVITKRDFILHGSEKNNK